MLKMVVSYIDRDKFDPIRADLLELGFLSISVSDVSGSVPEPTVSGRYRGAAFEQHLRPKARMECVVGAEHTQTVVDTVRFARPGRNFFMVSDSNRCVSL